LARARPISIHEFFRQLGDDEFVRFTQQPRQFFGRQRLSGFQGHPLRAGKIRRRDNVGALRELGKVFRRSFEGEADGSRLERSGSKHLPANFKQQVIAPLNLFRRAGKRKAQLAEPLNIHETISRDSGRDPLDRRKIFLPGHARGWCAILLQLTRKNMNGFLVVVELGENLTS
jgi:hypothetical protein